MPENKTGLPDKLKTGLERLSGMSMDHVKVHYNSAKPAQLNAHAYAQGTAIHVAPAFSNPYDQASATMIAHEAWHIVQQAQGRVKPSANGGIEINDDPALESEADEMAAKVVSGKF